MLGVIAAVFVLGACYCFKKRHIGKDGGEESEDDAPRYNITINQNSTEIHNTSSVVNNAY